MRRLRREIGAELATTIRNGALWEKKIHGQITICGRPYKSVRLVAFDSSICAIHEVMNS